MSGDTRSSGNIGIVKKNKTRKLTIQTNTKKRYKKTLNYASTSQDMTLGVTAAFLSKKSIKKIKLTTT